MAGKKVSIRRDGYGKILNYPVRDASSTLQELIRVINLRWPPAAKRFKSADLQGDHLLAPEQVMGNSYLPSTKQKSSHRSAKGILVSLHWVFSQAKRFMKIIRFAYYFQVQSFLVYPAELP